MDTSKLTREIKWRPAFDKRNPDPNKNYGIHGAEMAWYLKGPEGAITCMIDDDGLEELRESHSSAPVTE